MIDLRLGNCLELMQEIDDKSIDLILCDLPYGTTACSWDNIIPFDELWEQYNRIIKDRGNIVLFGQEPFSSICRTSNLDMYRYDWVWEKQRPSNFQLMNFQPGRIQENIMVFSKGKSCYTSDNNIAIYYPQKQQRNKNRKANVKIYGNMDTNILHNYDNGQKDNIKIYTDKLPTSILRFNTDEHKLHPTQKPIKLLKYLIKTYTTENSLVLDNCMGSGSTGVACVLLDRNFIGMEIDDKYFEIANNRINEAKQERKMMLW